jgi:Fe-S cluster assembly protein SufD
MNAEVRQMKTNAEIALAQAFASARAKLPGAGEIAAMREAAFRRFDAQGLPHRRVEEWKYTDLRALMRDAKPLAGVPDAAAKMRARSAGALLAVLDCRRVVFVDGAFVPELSDLASLEPGLSIRSLSEALAAGDPLVTEHLGKLAPQGDIAVALNTAFMGDGAVIHAAEGATITRPLQLVFANTGEQAAAIFGRSLVVAERGARLTLVESHEGPDGRDYQVNTAVELVVGADARVGHIKLTLEGARSLHISSLMAVIGAGAELNDFIFNTGGAVVRNQLFLRFDGEGTRANIRGASLLRGRQHVDTTLVVDHVAGLGQSREIFKSVLDDSSRAVFQGRIIVRPNAQKTDAKMMTRALLLSEDAEADNKPELEIFADDVQCGHGATAGALDQDLLFYLKARGIPTKEAEALLVQAFIGEAIDAVEPDGLRDALMDAATAWLGARK